MRIVAWNCNMAFHRKAEALRQLQPDIAVISECASPDVLTGRGLVGVSDENCLWIGDNPNKGLAVMAFNGYRVRRSEPYFPTLRFIAPIHVSGPQNFNLLAVWAQNASAGITRKRQSGPLRRSLGKYRDFLTSGQTLIAGDLNNNTIWDRPGWQINFDTMLRLLDALDLVSVYHHQTGERPGQELSPTLYWRDRKKDGPTYHIDYVFVPKARATTVSHFAIGEFEDWCGNGLSDHTPVVVDIDLSD